MDNQNDEIMLSEIFDKSERNFQFVAGGRASFDSDSYDINLNTILTKLIQDAGRFCEMYASDLFIDWTHILHTINSENDGIFAIGIRENGVDSNSYVSHHIKTDWNNYYYRRLYAVKVSHSADEIAKYVEVELRDIKPETNMAAYRFSQERGMHRA